MQRDAFETPVDRAIREAQERGEFDNLPGSGKPLDLGDADDPQWWVKKWVQREGLELAGALSPAIALRKEAAGFPESLADLRTEDAVRRVLEDFNRRVKLDRLRPAVGPHAPIIAPTVDVDEMVARWAAARSGAVAGRALGARAGTGDTDASAMCQGVDSGLGGSGAGRMSTRGLKARLSRWVTRRPR